MGRGSLELTAAAEAFVPVKVTDMAAIDIANVRFDFDLTFAALLMHADGTVYHRYGGRGPDRADGYLSLASLAQLLRDTVAEHEAYDKAPSPPQQEPAQRAIDLPVLQAKLQKGQKIDCVHCHTVNDAEAPARMASPSWTADSPYVFPDPQRIGLSLDREHQANITAVAKDSPAAAAGLRVGDELVALGEQRSVRTFTDVQWALDRADAGSGDLPVRIRRAMDEHDATLHLAAGWKRCDPVDYAWRPYKWNLSPSAGFGGPELTAQQKHDLGLPTDRFAFRVQYIVDWGERGYRGQAVKKAGLRKDDIVLSFGGKDDFASVPHFHAWVALTHRADEGIDLVVLRAGRRHTLHYALPR